MSTPFPPEWDSWRQEVERLMAVPPLRRNERTTRGSQDPKFALGDFLATLPSAYVDALAESVGEEPGQFRSYRDVATAVPAHRRVATSWSVHRNLRDRLDLLRDGLTVRVANKLIGGPPIDQKADQNRPVEERAEQVRMALSDPDVFEVIDRELAADRTARKIRGRARRVVSEHAARERELETELRALQHAKSPYEATVKAELDLNRATQLVHAIGKTLDDLPNTERLIAAIKELTAEATTILDAGTPPAGDSQSPFTVDAETWQDRPARAALSRSNQEFLSGDGRTVIECSDDGPP